MPNTPDKDRLPPGQTVVEDFPVLTYGPVPRLDLEKWSFAIFGLVEEPLELSYQEFAGLPRTVVRADFHCVTGWSRMDNLWEGVSLGKVLRLARPKPEAAFVLVHCYGGYTTNLPLEALQGEDVLLALRHDGQDLSPDHGWPLRLVVPGRYGYKSAKWIWGLEFLAADKPGFWEEVGYHNNADPWKEERFD